MSMSFDIIDLNNIANIDIVNVIVHDNVIIVNDIDIVNVNQTLSEVRCLYQPTWFDASKSAGGTCAYNLTISAQINRTNTAEKHKTAVLAKEVRTR